MKRYRRAILILADGARADVMQDLCARGELPEIGGHLVREGSLRAGVTSFPSTTGPAYLPYLTGCYPGTCNIPGIRWFDKDRYAGSRFSQDRFRSYVGAETLYINRDLKREVQTVFNRIPRSYTLFSPISRGAGIRRDKTWFSKIWYIYYGHLTDHWGIVDKAAEERVLKVLRQDPEFLFVVFPGVDKFSHLSSPFHPRTLQAYRDLDRAVGSMVRHLKKAGQWGETALFIVSDHGLSETSTHFPLNQFLEGEGLPTLFYPKVYFKKGVKVASMVSGNGMSHLYFKGRRKGWRGRLVWEELLEEREPIIQKLLERSEVDLLAAQKSDGSILVKSQRGEAVIRGEEGEVHYVVNGSDPFGYPPLPESMTDRQWLAATASSDYPDAPVQLSKIFSSRRTGDLILSASVGNDLRQRFEIPEHKSTHGSLHWEHMKIPIVSNLKLPGSHETLIRSIDILPTLLRLLDRPIPRQMEGRSLA